MENVHVAILHFSKMNDELANSKTDEETIDMIKAQIEYDRAWKDIIKSW